MAGLNERVPDRLLGPLERAVMEVVWATGQVTVREVHEALARDKKIAYTTVLTVMSRLAKKTILERAPQGTHHVYQARMTAEEFVEWSSRREVDRILAEFGDLAVTHFLQAASAVEPDLLDRLRRLAARSRRKTARRGQ